jgi:hypothetical protein
VLVVLALRLPFLHQAIQGDDDIYLAEGAHALIDPLHPQDTTYVFQGREVDLRGHSHPPLNGWILGGLLAVFGEVQEAPFHAAYIAFSLIAVWAMWSLARRFSPRPLWAALLFLSVPAFVVNGNSLEADLPFLACWMAAIALFGADRLALAVLALAAASLAAYQAVLLTPILMAYTWIFRRNDRRAWAVTLVPCASVAAWQIFEWITRGAFPAVVLANYLHQFQTPVNKWHSALALAVHSWFIVFPLLVPGALLALWSKRDEPGTRFLAAWLAVFYAGALTVFFAGAARYLLPVAAPFALLASRLRPRWLALGFAAQMALGLGLAAVNYQHWDGYRRFAQSLSAHRRTWVDGEWGLRFYLESRGALPLLRTQKLRPDDIVVSSALGHAVEVTAPLASLAAIEIRPALPLRLIGLESRSGYSAASFGLWPFGISNGVIDRVRAGVVGERHPTLEFLSLNAPEAAQHIVAGIWPDRWMSGSGALLLKSPEQPRPLAVTFYISDKAPARRVTLLLDGHEAASGRYPARGVYTLSTSTPVLPAGPTAAVEVRADRTFSPPSDVRDLGIVLISVGFVR